MKRTLIPAAAVLTAAAISAAAFIVIPTATSAPSGNRAAILASEGTALFKRGQPPWYYGARAKLTCVKETSVSYYCSVNVPGSSPPGVPGLHQPAVVLSEYFVRVTGGFAIWNAISADSLNSGNSSLESSGPIWSSTIVAMTKAP